MNKNIIVGLVAVLVLGTAGFIAVSDSDEGSMNSEQSQTVAVQQSDESPIESVDNEQNPQESVQVAGAYVDYSDSALTDADGTERVLFFHAPWCSVCNFHDGKIKENGVPAGITVIKIDYDSEDALKEQYDVSVQSTFVYLNADGSVKQTWPFASGLQTPQDLFDVVLAG